MVIWITRMVATRARYCSDVRQATICATADIGGLEDGEPLRLPVPPIVVDRDEREIHGTFRAARSMSIGERTEVVELVQEERHGDAEH